MIRPPGLIACAALAASCAQSVPPMEIPVAAHVMVSRVISENVPPRPPDCTIETLTAMPAQPYRELGEIQLAAPDPNQHDVRAVVSQHACAMGADAVVIKPVSGGGGLLDATAIAYASSLATRAAQAQSGEAASASGSTAQSPGLEAPRIPMAAPDEAAENSAADESAQETAPPAEPQAGADGGSATMPAQSTPASSITSAALTPTSSAAAAAATSSPPSMGPATTLTLKPVATPTALPSPSVSP